jgi:hypothetical protein
MPSALTPLYRLRHLAIEGDGYASLSAASVPEHWHELITRIGAWGSPLSTLSMRLNVRLPLKAQFFKELLNAHASTLRQLSFINCDVPIDSIRMITTHCAVLEKLTVPVPVRAAVSLRVF